MDVGLTAVWALLVFSMHRTPVTFWMESAEHALNVASSPPTWPQGEGRLALIVLQPELETWDPA